jgi:hypothetical protein
MSIDCRHPLGFSRTLSARLRAEPTREEQRARWKLGSVAGFKRYVTPGPCLAWTGSANPGGIGRHRDRHVLGAAGHPADSLAMVG